MSAVLSLLGMVGPLGLLLVVGMLGTVGWPLGLLVVGMVMVAVVTTVAPATPSPTPAVMRWVEVTSAWQWLDEERRRATPPPNIMEVVAAALRRHGQVSVAKALGLSRQTCLALGGGFTTNQCVYIVAGQRLHELARLGEEL